MIGTTTWLIEISFQSAGQKRTLTGYLELLNLLVDDVWQRFNHPIGESFARVLFSKNKKSVNHYFVFYGYPFSSCSAGNSPGPNIICCPVSATRTLLACLTSVVLHNSRSLTHRAHAFHFVQGCCDLNPREGCVFTKII